MRKLFVCLLVLFYGFSSAQELNCTVTFNTDQVGATNQQIFVTLNKSLQEFLNNTKWSSQEFKANEKIECSFFFNFTSYNVNQFTANLQVQVSRPVFNSTYKSPILNINDKDINFTYTEFQNLFFDPNSFDSNLVSLLAFYANMIIGVDADTFSLEGGTKSLEQAQNIVNVAQQSQLKGWNQGDGNQNRYFLVNDMLSPTYSPFRKTMFEYHLLAIDNMSEDQKKAKENIVIAIKTLTEVADARPNAYLTRVFFDAKADELLSIYSDGPKIDVTNLLNNLNRLSPTNASKWGEIRN